MKNSTSRWTVLLAVNVAAWCMLGFYVSSDAAPGEARQPFGNAVAQRQEMIRELHEIKALLKEQNTILRTGLFKNAQNEPRQP